MYKHDLQHTGRSQYAVPSEHSLLWKFNVDGMPGNPAIGADGIIYLPVGLLNKNTVGYLYAIKPDGSLKWRYQFEGLPSSTTPAIAADGTIYVHMNGNEGNIVAVEKLYAINPDGTLKWLFIFNEGAGVFTSYIISSPAIGADGTIYAGSNDTRLYAINKDGTLKWRKSTTFSSINSSPAISKDGTIYISDATFELSSFMPDGTKNWTTDFSSTGGSGENTPAIGADGTIYLSDYWGPGLLAINTDGTLKWKYTQLKWHPLSSPSFSANNDIYICDDGLYSFNSEGVLNWKTSNLSSTESSPVVDLNGTIFWRESWDFFADNPDGTQKWSMNMTCQNSSTDPIPAIGSGGTLYVPLQDEFEAANQFLAAYGSTPTKVINNFSPSEKIKIFPNPTSGIIEIFIDVPFDDECNIMIFNNLGSLIQNISINSNVSPIRIDLSGCATGLYFIRIGTKDFQYQYKIMKE